MKRLLLSTMIIGISGSMLCMQEKPNGIVRIHHFPASETNAIDTYEATYRDGSIDIAKYYVHGPLEGHCSVDYQYPNRLLSDKRCIDPLKSYMYLKQYYEEQHNPKQ